MRESGKVVATASCLKRHRNSLLPVLTHELVSVKLRLPYYQTCDWFHLITLLVKCLHHEASLLTRLTKSDDSLLQNVYF